MKNIYVLPTNGKTKLRKLYETLELSSVSSIFNYGVHIYIISSSDIKVGDWCIDLDTNNVFKLGKFTTDRAVKIILTTDPKLIADGVQAINDEFLEWFVTKNPNCQFVDVKMEKFGVWRLGYKIIIPQEELKQELPIINGSYGCTIQTNKQETLEEKVMETQAIEEAAEKFYPPTTTDLICSPKLVRDAFVAGANWQEKRMYSEDEVIELLEYTRENFYDTGTKWHEEPYKDLTSKELLEQFKKK